MWTGSEKHMRLLSDKWNNNNSNSNYISLMNMSKENSYTEAGKDG